MAKVFVESVLEKQKKDGSGVFFVCAMEIDGKAQEVTVYDPKIKEFKQKEVELDIKEGKYGLIGNFPGGGQKPQREWKQQDPDSMYRCNASDKATQIWMMIAKENPKFGFDDWDYWYDHIYAKMAGKPTAIIAPKKEDVPDFEPVEEPAQSKINPGQQNAILDYCRRLHVEPGKKIKAIIARSAKIDDLTNAEAKLIITTLGRELDATGL